MLFHNAAVLKLGNVEDVRLPHGKMLPRQLQRFLPQMKERNSGTIVFVPASGAAHYMGAYEVFKTAQLELCNTLAGELEGTRIFTRAIGTGLVKMETAMEKNCCGKNGHDDEEFYALNGSHILSAEEAGCGFALSVLSAEKYNGQEIGSSIHVLSDSGLTDQYQAKSAIGICRKACPSSKK